MTTRVICGDCGGTMYRYPSAIDDERISDHPCRKCLVRIGSKSQKSLLRNKLPAAKETKSA
jgi:reverse gyrase